MIGSFKEPGEIIGPEEIICGLRETIRVAVFKGAGEIMEAAEGYLNGSFKGEGEIMRAAGDYLSGSFRGAG